MEYFHTAIYSLKRKRSDLFKHPIALNKVRTFCFLSTMYVLSIIQHTIVESINYKVEHTQRALNKGKAREPWVEVVAKSIDQHYG